jgi:hypothetical protein
MGTSQSPDRRGPRLLVRREEDILQFALDVAAMKGDSAPELVQHTAGSREAATKTTGSWVRSEAPSYLIAMRGKFTAPAAPDKSATRRQEDGFVSYSVQVLVVDIETGQLTDSGGGDDYPDLASVGAVVTDYRGSS